MHETRSTLVPLIIGDAASLLGRLCLLEQIGMITFFDPQEIAEIVVLQGLDVGSIRTQTVFGND